MTAEQLLNISVIDPISPAIGRVNTILFKPFNLKRWFVIGFCAWLAFLGEGGGGSHFNFSYREHRGDFEVSEVFHEAKEFILDNLHWIIPAAVAIVVVGIVLCLVITWLSSRGRFMFLHCVVQNKAEIKVPWHKFRQHANSLFLFRIVLGIISFLVGAFFCLTCLSFILLLKSTIGFNIFSIFGVVLFVLLFIAIFIVFSLIHKFTKDFVVPVMYLRTTSCTAAWREFLTLLSANKGRFTLYILFQIVIAITVGMIGAAVACVFSCLLILFTCFTACCFMILPPFSIGFGYLITVLLLPLSVFTRSYSLLYFRQFGPRFNVFSPEIEPA